MYANLLKLILFLLLTNLLGCQITPQMSLVDLNLTEAQKKALSENYYVIPKEHFYPPRYSYYGGDYTDLFWDTNWASHQDYARWMAYQHALEVTRNAREARETWGQTTTPTPASSNSPTSSSTSSNTSTQCSAATPCKQFKLR